MKKLTKLLIVAALAAFIPTAHAQMFQAPATGSPVYPDSTFNLATLLPGGAVGIPAASTNVFIQNAATNTFGVPHGWNIGQSTNLMMVACSFTNASVTFSFVGSASSANGLYIYQSDDTGSTFNPQPIWSETGIAPGAALYGTNFTLSVSAGSVLAFVVTSTGTTGVTNALLECNASCPTIASYPASR